MPDHVHLLVLPLAESSSVSRLLYAIKRPFSYRVRRWLATNDPALLSGLTVRERPNKMAFRFWQEGSGYDRDVEETASFWQAVDYIHENPVEAGLCALAGDWPWTSWHWWENRVQRPLLPRMAPLPED